MINIISLTLYIITVVAGLFVDNRAKAKPTRLKALFICWLFLFYCFGYMVGDDWRNYEVIYNDPTSYKMLRFISEPLSYLSFSLFPKIIPDFWLYFGLMKCAYLYSVIKLSKRITPQWISCVSIMTMGQLNFLLIDCPLRFMLALIFINIALYIVLGDKNKRLIYYIKIICLLLVSVCFHNTCLFYFLIIPFLSLSTKLYRINRPILFISYCFLILITNNASLINSLIGLFSGIMRNLSLSASGEYMITESSSLFTIGNITQIFLFALIISSRDKVCRGNEKIQTLYCLTILYFYMSRLFLVVPTGFRLPMPFSIFYIAYIICLLNKRLLCGQLILLYMFISFTINTWNSFNMLPYSNSIPYIIAGHKPYSERYYYNFNAYRERMGHNHPKYYEYLYEE